MRVRALLMALAALAVVAAIAPAVGSSASHNARVEAVGKDVAKINKYMKTTLRFRKRVTVAKAGSSVRFVNRTREPHSLSVVKRADLPSNTREVFACFEGAPCGPFFGAHEFPQDDGPPGKPVVDADNDGGVGAPGDSIVIGPKGEGGSTEFKLTAKKGRTLYFLCIFHPWMQGQLKAN